MSFGKHIFCKSTFFFLIQKVIRKVNKHGNEVIIIMFYKINIIDSARFKASSLSSLVGHVAEEIFNFK